MQNCRDVVICCAYGGVCIFSGVFVAVQDSEENDEAATIACKDAELSDEDKSAAAAAAAAASAALSSNDDSQTHTSAERRVTRSTMRQQQNRCKQKAELFENYGHDNGSLCAFLLLTRPWLYNVSYC